MGWDRELGELEQAIRQLNAEYDAFLYGTEPGAHAPPRKPPIEGRKRVEERLRRLSAVEPESAADGYRLVTLQGRYSSLCERWERLQAEKESGRRPGTYARFAHPSSERADPVAPNAPAAPSVKGTGPVRPRERELFEEYIGAKKARGEDVSGYDFARFAESLQRERQKLQQQFGSVEIEFHVAERNGDVKLVAKKKA